MRSTVDNPFPGVAGWGHRPHLDGLRAVAVYAVVLFHAGVVRFGGGFVGVDLFFVLSGYLITSLLVTEMVTTHKVDLPGFYSRRVRRLLPASIAVIVAVSVVLLLTTTFTKRLRYVEDARSALLYFSNWSLIDRENDYFSFGRAPSPFLHFWSLSLEEQFYIVFPLLMAGLALVLRRRPRPSTLLAPLAVLMVASLALQLYWQANDPIRAYYGTDARVYQILAGSLLAIVRLRGSGARSASRPMVALAPLGLVVFVVACTDLLDVSVSTRGIIATAASLMMLLGLEAVPHDGLAKLLSRRPMERLGQVSYGTYLFHWPATVLLLRSSLSPWVIAVVVAVAATSAAFVSSRLFETPIRRSPALARRPLGTVAAGLALSVVGFVAVVPGLLESTRRPVYPRPAQPDARLGARGAEAVPQGLDFRAALANQAPVVSCDPTAVEECAVRSEGTTRVLLVGDSHARMLLPGLEQLAQTHDFALYANIVQGCPWQAGYVGEGRPKTAQDQCEDRRAGWYDDALAQIAPDVVILASYPYNVGKDLRLVDTSVADLVPHDRYLTLSRRTIEQISSGGATVVVVEPVPVSKFDPLDCLSGAEKVGECVFSATTTSMEELLIEAASAGGATLVDIDDFACPDLPDCYPLVDGIIVRRDDSHLTADYVAARAEALWAHLAPALDA